MLPVSQSRINPNKNIYNTNAKKLNFKSKFNVIDSRGNKYLFDSELIKNFSSNPKGTLLNLKERILHSIPDKEILRGYYIYRAREIAEKSVIKKPNQYSHVEVVGGYEKAYGAIGFDNVYAPAVADAVASKIDNEFWSDYGVNQLLINTPYKQFLELYSEAILPENATKIYNI